MRRGKPALATQKSLWVKASSTLIQYKIIRCNINDKGIDYRSIDV